jgi:hypothetical protein
MRTKATLIIILLLAASAIAQMEQAQQKPPKTVGVNIEASEYDRRMLLEKLNEHGREQGLRFEQSDKGFTYRIVFKVEQGTKIQVAGGTGGTSNTSEATATVFDAKGAELFEFRRANRRTDGGATNAAAKEIIKRMLKLQAPAAGS